MKNSNPLVECRWPDGQTIYQNNHLLRCWVPVQGEAVALPERARLRVDDGAAPRQLVVVEHVEVVGAAALGAVRGGGAELEGDAVVEAGGGAGVGLVADVGPDAPHGFGRV